MAQVVKSFPRKHEALSPNPSITNDNNDNNELLIQRGCTTDPQSYLCHTEAKHAIGQPTPSITSGSKRKSRMCQPAMKGQINLPAYKPPTFNLPVAISKV
jgi:hypothetical protein